MFGSQPYACKGALMFPTEVRPALAALDEHGNVLAWTNELAAEQLGGTHEYRLQGRCRGCGQHGYEVKRDGPYQGAVAFHHTYNSRAWK